MLDKLKIYEFEIDARITEVLFSGLFNPKNKLYAIQVILEFSNEWQEYIYNVLLWKEELRKVREINTLFIYFDNEQEQKEARNKIQNLLNSGQELKMQIFIKSLIRDVELKKLKWTITSNNQTIMKGVL